MVSFGGSSHSSLQLNLGQDKPFTWSDCHMLFVLNFSVRFCDRKSKQGAPRIPRISTNLVCLSSTISCFRRFRFNILSCAVIIISVLALPVNVTSSTNSNSAPTHNSLELNIGILAVELCNATYRTQIENQVNQAIAEFNVYIKLTEGDLNPNSVEINHTIYPFCKSRNVISNLHTIFSNDTVQVILSIATYDIHSSLIPLAQIYKKGYIPVNAYIFQLVQAQSISFAPTFDQSGLMLATVLDIYKWQNVFIIYSNFNYWIQFATYMYFAMTSRDFKVNTSNPVFSPLTSGHAVEALMDASGSKVILLLMDLEDQKTILAAASSLSMTTNHAYFTFTKTPYDNKTQSISGVEPAILKESRFLNDSQNSDINIMESVFVLGFSFPASKQNSTTETKLHKRAVNTHQFDTLFKDIMTRLNNDKAEYGDHIPTYLQVDNSLNKLDDNFDSKITAADTIHKTTNHQGVVKPKDTTSKIPYGSENVEYTQLVTDSQMISTNTFVPGTSSDGSSLFVQARQMSTTYDDVFRRNMDSSITEDLNRETEESNSELLDTVSELTRDRDPGSQYAQELVYESENQRWLPTSGDEIGSWKRGDPTLTSHFRSRRDSEQSGTSNADLYAIYDIVFVLALAVHQNAKTSNTLMVSEKVIESLRDLTFPGHSGEFKIDQNKLVSFDFSLYDFDVESGRMVQRMFFQATNSVSWVKMINLPVAWPGGFELSPDECFKQLPGCNNGLKSSIIAGIVVSALTVVIVVILAAVTFRRHWANKEMTRGPNKVILFQEDLVYVLRKDMGKGSRIMKSRVTVLEKDSAPDLIRASEPNRSLGSINELSDYTETARYNGDLVHIKELNIKGFEMRNKLLTFIRMCRDLRHENLNPYVGFLADPSHPSIVMEYCSRGSLYDIVHNDDFKLDWDFKLSLLTDLVRGIRYMHSSPLKCHGHMTSKNCVIDSRFVLKITDYGVPGIMDKCRAIMFFNSKDLLWSAPELLRDESFLQRGSDKGDIYAMSIIFQEVALRTEPYSTTGLLPEEIVKKLKKPPPLIRPSVTPQAGPPLFIQIMKQCWSESPEMRPGIDEIYDQFKKLTGGKKANIVDTMFKMLEKYSTDLEDIVADRTMQLEEEKKKTDQLLFRMLPPTVAENLKIGRTVEAEVFDDVTIYFSDIVGFTTISAMSTPMQVVDLLNDLYSMFDATINNHDVYKVETIGDAYMVVSGLPVRNGNRHAGEIGTLALVLLSQCGQFTIRHMPQVPLRLRIGLHTGSCVAGVVGLTMPRFCLFGDTVNTASRMESSGAAFRVHLSETCKVALDVLGGYKTEYRGQTELKGKGMYNTYWLTGREGFDLDLPEPPPILGDNTHGLDSILGDLKVDFPTGLDLPQNDIISKSNSAPNLATPTSTPKLANPKPSSNEVNAASSHPDNLHELHKQFCKKTKTTNSNVVTADINIIGGGVNNDITHSSSNKKNGNSAEPTNGTCQSRHSESNDSGFGSERKHSEGNDGYPNNWTNYNDELSNSEQFKRSNQQNSNRIFITPSSNTVSRKSSYLPVDGDDLTTVTEV